jgi:hypothetical protein
VSRFPKIFSSLSARAIDAIQGSSELLTSLLCGTDGAKDHRHEPSHIGAAIAVLFKHPAGLVYKKPWTVPSS